MNGRYNDQDQFDEDDIDLIIPYSQEKSDLSEKLSEAVSKVEEQLNIPIQSDLDDQNLDLFDRILRIGSNIFSLHQRISSLIADIIKQDNKDPKFIEDILYTIKEKLQDTINIPTEDIEVQEAIQKIHKMAYCYVEEPEKLQKVLQQSAMIHQNSESKIKYLQGRIMDLEQQVNFFIENQNPISSTERIENEQRIKENDELKQENINLRRKYKDLALKYKKISDQKNIENLSFQIKKLQSEIDGSKETINNQAKEINETRTKMTKTEADLSKFKKAYIAIKKRYDIILESTKGKDLNQPKNNEIEKSKLPKESS